jgi:hypothetical protein
MFICTSQSLFSHSYVLNRYCDVRNDIGIREDEVGISAIAIFTSRIELMNWVLKSLMLD